MSAIGSPRRRWTFGSVLAGLAGAFAIAGCGSDGGVVDPPDEDPPDSAVVASITLRGRQSLLTVLGTKGRLTVLARDANDSVLCAVPSLGCSSRLLDRRFRWTMDVPGVVSLEEYDPGLYPNGGVHLVALAEGRVQITASVDGVDGTAVVDVVERARIAWSLPTMASIRGIAVGEDGTIYAAAALGLQAVTAQGELLWSVPVRVRSLPAIAGDGTLYLATGDGLSAIDPDGTLLWTTPVDDVRSAPAIGPDGTVYLVTTVGTLYAVAPTGEILWTFATAPGPLQRNFSSPAIARDGTIYFGSEDQHLYAVAPDGSERWRFRTGGPVETPSIGVDGTVYVANDRTAVWSDASGLVVLADSRMFALDPDGTERWSATLEGDAWSAPAIGFDGSIYLGTINGGDLYVFAPDGSLLRKVGVEAGHTPVVAGDGSIYRSLGPVTAVAGDGTPRWGYQPGNGASPAPAIGFDGTVYAGVSEGRDGPYLLLAFDELEVDNRGYRAAPWPQERGDRANTGRARAAP